MGSVPLQSKWLACISAVVYAVNYPVESSLMARLQVRVPHCTEVASARGRSGFDIWQRMAGVKLMLEVVQSKYRSEEPPLLLTEIPDAPFSPGAKHGSQVPRSPALVLCDSEH